MGTSASSHAPNSPPSVAADPLRAVPPGKGPQSVAKDRKGSGRFRFPFLGAPETKLPDPVDGNASEERLGKLQEDALAAAESETKHGAVNEDARRIWVFGARSDTVRLEQRFYLPTRFLSVLRKGKDVAVIPGNHGPTLEYVDFVKQVVGFNDDQIIFTSGNHASLDEDIMAEPEVAERLEQIVRDDPDSQFVIIPYVATEAFYKWVAPFQALGVQTFGESTEWLAQFGDKGILHRHMKDLSQPSVIEMIDPNIPIAPGYICSTPEQLLEAYHLLGCKAVAIKPLCGCAGEGIIFVDNEEAIRNYEFPMGDVALEEKLELDLAEDGLVIAPAMHYMQRELIGGGLVDQILEGASYMGWRASVVSEEFREQVDRITRTIIDYTSPQGPGGYDYLSVKGKPVLNDINTGRFNGAHQPKLFLQMHAPDAEWYCWRFKPAQSLGIWDFWNALLENGSAFLPGVSESGVFPLTYSRGIAGTFIAIAKDRETCLELYRRAAAVLTQHGSESD